jgi:hypothetical protein
MVHPQPFIAGKGQRDSEFVGVFDVFGKSPFKWINGGSRETRLGIGD